MSAVPYTPVTAPRARRKDVKPRRDREQRWALTAAVSGWVVIALFVSAVIVCALV